MPDPGSADRRRATAVRLFLTCWLVYSFHVATNMVRENYLALAIGDHASFRVDEYAGMHDDIFEHPGFGWHIGSNPGASMLGAIPYALSRPVIDRIVRSVQESRDAAANPPAYAAPTETDRRFYEEAWRRGFDVKFGLASVVMQSLAMAVVSSLGVVLLYLLLAAWLGNATPALWLAMATAGLVGFAALWNPWNAGWLSRRRAFALTGLAGGTCVLLDYSGVIMLVGLFLHGVWVARQAGDSWSEVLQLTFVYAGGAIGPLVLLWFYQWQSFGHPFLPPQHWMPPVEYIGEGYQGVSLPAPGIAGMLAFDFRYGLFTSCPLFLLAAGAFFVNDRDGPALPRRELMVLGALSLGLFLFFSGVHYTRWQFNTGVRYLAPIFPYLFLLASVVLLRLPRAVAVSVGALSVAFGWCLAMVRDVSGGKVDLADPDTGLGVLDPVIAVLTGGPRLPVLTTLSRMEGYGPLSTGLSPILIMSVLGLLLVLIWRAPVPGAKP
jgi:MFS family permease